jgi:hypothetical protein
MYSESEHRPPEIIAEELSRENDCDEAAELATELALSLEDQKKKRKVPLADGVLTPGGEPAPESGRR